MLCYHNMCNNCIKLRKNQEIDINEFIKKLINIGYERVHTTYNVGEFSVRGEILDIYPSCSDKPIRINFPFDEIETIKSLHSLTFLYKTHYIRKLNSRKFSLVLVFH